MTSTATSGGGKPDLYIDKSYRLFHVQVKERMAQNHWTVTAGMKRSLVFCSCLVSHIFLPMPSVTGGWRFVSHCWFSLPVYWVRDAQDHHDGARTNASMLHNILKHEQTLNALLSKHAGGSVRTLFCGVDWKQLDNKQTSVAGTFWRSESVGWTCGYVPSVDFCVVVGITELHFKQTMRSWLELRTNNLSSNIQYCFKGWVQTLLLFSRLFLYAQPLECDVVVHTE